MDKSYPDQHYRADLCLCLSPAVTLPWQMPSPVSSGVTTCPRCWPSSPSRCRSPSSRTRWHRLCRRWAGHCPTAPCSRHSKGWCCFWSTWSGTCCCTFTSSQLLCFQPYDLLFRVLVPKSCGYVQGERMLCAGKAQSWKKYQMFLFMEWCSRENWSSFWSVANCHKLVGLNQVCGFLTITFDFILFHLLQVHNLFLKAICLYAWFCCKTGIV